MRASNPPTVVFRTSMARFLVSTSWGMLFVFVVVVGALLIKDIGSLSFAIPFGISTSVLAGAYFTWRFHKRSLRELRISTQELLLVPRHRSLPDQAIPWISLVDAKFETAAGECWTLKTETGQEIEILDDGFSKSDWLKLGEAIKAVVPHLDQDPDSTDSEANAEAEAETDGTLPVDHSVDAGDRGPR